MVFALGMQGISTDTETLTDDNGCTTEGYRFEMIFVTKVVGSDPLVESYDDFSIFFRTSIDCSSQPPSEC